MVAKQGGDWGREADANGGASRWQPLSSDVCAEQRWISSRFPSCWFRHKLQLMRIHIRSERGACALLKESVSIARTRVLTSAQISKRL